MTNYNYSITSSVAGRGSIASLGFVAGAGAPNDIVPLASPNGQSVDIVQEEEDEFHDNPSDGVGDAINDDDNQEPKTADGNHTDEKNPWSRNYCGIPISYFNVGFMMFGSLDVLYPVLIIENGVSSSFYSAARSLVILFWSYKILFGILSDCVPIRGLRRKPYIIFGWTLCAAVFFGLAGVGDRISPSNLVLMLTLANFGYVLADVASDGFMVWMAHHESEERRGKIQNLLYIMREVGGIIISIVISKCRVAVLLQAFFWTDLLTAAAYFIFSHAVFAFSGPKTNCHGYESDPNVACTTDQSVASSNSVYVQNPENPEWCHQVCDDATFPFGLTVPQYSSIFAVLIILSIPTYFLLNEEKREPEKAKQVLVMFWNALKKKAVWMLVLYKLVSTITYDVYVAAKSNANFVWLDFTNVQNELQSIFEKFIFLAGLMTIRRYW